jgi:hypothetical protein
VRQTDDLFRVATFIARRNEDTIGDDIVHIVRAHRAGIAEIVHLQRRGPPGEESRPGVLGESVEVDQDIDLLCPDPLSDPVDIGLSETNELVEGFFDSGTDLGLVARRDRETDHLESRAVVNPKDAGCQKRHRVLPEIGGDIAEPDSRVVVAFSPPQRQLRRIPPFGPGPRAPKLLLG